MVKTKMSKQKKHVLIAAAAVLLAVLPILASAGVAFLRPIVAGLGGASGWLYRPLMGSVPVVGFLTSIAWLVAIAVVLYVLYCARSGKYDLAVTAKTKEPAT